mgnify:FL=1|tara:strand:- start:103 stop:414 length:312 start_codon:yes stop_codon:yes gene_type:complete
MIYTKEITKDLATQMAKHRAEGKSVDASAKEATKWLNKKYNAKFKWTGVRSKFYDKAHRPNKRGESIIDPTFKDLKYALSSLARTSDSITIEIRGKAVTVVYK